MTDDAKIYPLTSREFDVCRLVADGLTNAQIGGRLAITPSTVASHVESIHRKLRTRNRVEMARWFWRGRVSTLAEVSGSSELEIDSS